MAVVSLEAARVRALRRQATGGGTLAVGVQAGLVRLCIGDVDGTEAEFLTSPDYARQLAGALARAADEAETGDGGTA